MRVYFTGTDLNFIHRIREMVQFQGKEDEVIILPNKYIEDMTLLYYDQEKKKLIRIEDLKGHSF